MKLKLFAAAAALCLAAMPASAVDLIQNGSFNLAGGTDANWIVNGHANLTDGNTYVTGWTVGTGTADIGAQVWYYPTGSADVNPGWLGGWQIHGPANGSNNGFTVSPDGGALVEIDGGGDYRGSMTQMVNGLTVGKAYNLKFFWAGAQQSCCGGTTTEQLHVTFGNDVWQSAVWNNPEAGFSGWFSENVSFTATSSSQLLTFLAIGTPYGQPPVVLLDGVSLLAAVPEPASWAMLIMGFGLVGAAARRRKAVAVAA